MVGTQFIGTMNTINAVFLVYGAQRLVEKIKLTHIRIQFTAAAAKSLQSCPTLCDPIDRSPPGSPVPGILQARTLEGVAISFSKAWKWKVKVKLLSRVRLSDPMDYSLPGSSIHGVFQARVLEWGAIAFSDSVHSIKKIGLVIDQSVEAGVFNWLCPIPSFIEPHPSSLHFICSLYFPSQRPPPLAFSFILLYYAVCPKLAVFNTLATGKFLQRWVV